MNKNYKQNVQSRYKKTSSSKNKRAENFYNFKSKTKKADSKKPNTHRRIDFKEYTVAHDKKNISCLLFLVDLVI